MLSDCLESSRANSIAITRSRRAARTLDASKLIKSVLGLGALLTHFNYLNLLQGGTPFQGVLGTYWNQTADVRGPPGGDKNKNISKCICTVMKRRTLTWSHKKTFGVWFIWMWYCIFLPINCDNIVEVWTSNCWGGCYYSCFVLMWNRHHLVKIF